MPGIGLMLFCLRGLSDWLLQRMFRSLNIGLAMMVFMSLAPAGIYQAWASISQGVWFARSLAVVHSAVMESLVWLRVPGDVVFGIGILFLELTDHFGERIRIAYVTRAPGEFVINFTLMNE